MGVGALSISNGATLNLNFTGTRRVAGSADGSTVRTTAASVAALALWLALKPIQVRHIVVSRVMTGETSCMRCFSAASRG